MLKTLSQATASATLTFGAFAVPFVILLAGDLGFDPAGFVETPYAEAAAPMTMLPVPQTPTDAMFGESMPLAEADVALVSSVPGAQVAGARREGGRASSNVRTASTAEKKKGKKAKCLGDNPGIERMGASSFAIERTLIKYYGSHLGELNRLGNAGMYKVDGKSEGFVVRGIQCGNDLHEAGIRNGDVIHSVNGKSVKNIPQALAAYVSLKGKDILTLSITRKGAKKEMTYHLG